VITSHTHHLPGAPESAEARFAQRVALRLSEGTERFGADISERLRFARESALQRARMSRALTAAVPTLNGNGAASLTLAGWSGGWGLKAASLLPLIALVAGLLFIQHAQREEQISVAAEIDADLLADDLPPKAYSDVGFVEFLKLPKD
jgi:Protein of unknown function (DUF3619)